MKCEEFRDKLPDVLTGELPPRAKAAFDAHLADCAACAGELHKVSEVWAKLGVIPAEQPSPAVRDRFYAMLESYQDGLRAEDASAAPRRRAAASLFAGFRTWRPAFQLAAALVLVAFGLGAGFFLSRASGATSRLANEVEGMRQTLSAALLAQPSPADRIQGVNTSARLKRPDPTTLGLLLRTLDEDPSLNVRLAAVDALYLFSSQPGVREGVVASLAKQTSPILQVALIDLLVEIRETRAAAALKSLIASEGSAPEVRKRAELGIKELGL
jgi:hypothetical protein